MQTGAAPPPAGGPTLEIARLREEARLLAEVSEALAVTTLPAEVGTALTSLLVPGTFDHLELVVPEAGGSLRSLGCAPPLAEVLAPGGDHGPWRVFRTGGPELLATLPSGDDPFLRRLRSLDVVSVLCVPVTCGKRVLGALTVAQGPSGRLLEPDPSSLVVELARRAGGALEAASLTAALETARRAEVVEQIRAARLEDLAGALGESVHADQVADAVVRKGLGALGASAGLVVRLDPGGEALELLRHSGLPGERVAAMRRIPLDGASPLAEAVLRRKPLWVEASALQGPWRDLAPEGAGAFAALPLLVERRPVGALWLAFAGPPREAERDHALAVARHCATALDRARLYQAEREARAAAEASERRLAFLSGASALLATSLDPAATLAAVARLAVPELADWCMVYVRDASGDLKTLAAAHLDAGKVAQVFELERRWPILADAPQGPGLVARTALPELRPFITPQMLAVIARDQDHLRQLQDLAFCSSLAVPLVARGNTLGVLRFAMAESGRRYSPSDVSLAEELASRAALAVDNARLYQAEQDASRAREELLAMVSHDLRNPLATIRMSAQHSLRLLAEGGDPRVLRSTEAIVRSSDQAARLIQDLLELSYIEAGRLSVRKEECAADALLASAVELLSPLTTEAGVRLDASAPPGLTVPCDRARILQVLSNLVSNALKVTPPGGTVSVRAWAEGTGVSFAVGDTGPGIDAADLVHVFERWWRASPITRSGGAGLGLFISKGIVEAHGGHIDATSSPGHGSVFAFHLPS